MVLPSDFLETDDISEQLMDEWTKKRAARMIESQKRDEAVEAEEYTKYSIAKGDYSEAHLKKLNMLERRITAIVVCLT